MRHPNAPRALWLLPLLALMESSSNAIGELTALNDSEFIVIERDGGEGSSARFKRIYKLDLRNADADGTLRKDLLVDLMQIGDPDGITAAEAGAIGLGEVFKFPFVTIESVYPVGAHAAGDQR